MESIDNYDKKSKKELIDELKQSKKEIVSLKKDIINNKNDDSLFNEAIDSLNEPIHIIDRDYKIIFINSKFKKLLSSIGFSDDVIGLKVYEAFNIPFKKILKEYDEVFASKKEIITEETTVVDKINTYTITKKLPILDKNNEVIKIITIIDNITEKKNVALALEYSEYKSHKLVEDIGEGIGIVDSNECFTFANPSMELIFGVEKGELIGKCLFDFTDTETTEIILSQTRIRKKKKKSAYQIFLNKNTKDEKFINVTATPQFDSQGKVIETLAIVRDITEERKIQSSLMENNNRIRAILDATPDMLLIIDENGEYIDAKIDNNNELTLIKKGIIDKNISDMGFSQTQKWNILEKISNTLKSKKLNTIEYSLKINDTLNYYLARIVPFNHKYILASIRNISNEIKNKRSLTQSEKKYRDLFNNAEVGLFQSRVFDFKLQECNDLFFTMFGFKNKELCLNEHRIEDSFVDIKERDKIFSIIEEAGEIHNFEIELYKKDRSKFWVSFSANFYQKKEYIEGVINDISKQKKFESASKLKSEFLANMSHEIRTPLNGVIGLTDILLRSEINEKQQSYLSTIEKSGKLLLNLVNDILDFSKIEEGKLRLEIIDFDIRKIFAEIIDSNLKIIKEKKLDISYNVSSNIPKILKGSPFRINQILTNLIGNAIKFTDSGKIIIYCSIENESIKDFKLRFEVNDTGIGIPLEMQSLIFEKFSQADGSMTRKFGGTGLGLAICKQLTELMQGEIGVISPSKIFSLGEKGTGSTFWFTAKLLKSDSINIEEEKVIQINNSSFTTNPKILLVEDNSTNRFVAKEILNELGYFVDDAENGLIAIEKLKTEKYELIFMDIQMPTMDGISATKIIRSKSSDVLDKKIPIVAMTANALKGDRELCLEAGMDDYITKPITIQDIENILSVWIEKKENSTLKTDKISNKIIVNTNKDRKVFNQNKLLKLFKYREDKVKKVCKIFIKDTQKEIDEIEKNINLNNLEVLTHLAHTIKGSSANIGADLLYKTSFELENAGNEKNLKSIKSIFLKLKKEFDLLKKEIIKVLKF